MTNQIDVLDHGFVRLVDCMAMICGLAIDRKMRVNRARVWMLRGDGHGDHVKTE